jgi:short-subunit dehydrogenase
MKLSDMKVLFTGAAGGIGHACCTALAKGGATLMLTGRSTPALAALAARLGSEAQFITGDLTLPDDRARVVDAASEWGCNVLIHGAGVASFGRFADLSSAQIDQVIATNLLAPLHLSRQLLPQLSLQPHSRIVFMGSVLGQIGLPGYALYGASKAGLHGLAEALRREWRDSGVLVQYLGPRATRTSFNSPASEQFATMTGSGSDSTEVVARALIDLLERDAAERFLGRAESWFVRLNALLGARIDRAFEKHRDALSRVHTHSH